MAPLISFEGGVAGWLLSCDRIFHMSPFFRLSFLFMSDSFFTEYELGELLDQSNQDKPKCACC